MPGLVINGAEAFEARKPLPAGEYHAVLTKTELKEAVAADKYPAINCTFTIHEDEGEPYAGKSAFRLLSASPKAVPYMLSAAIAMGADSDELMQPAVDMEQVFKDLEGRDCWIKTSIRRYQRNEGEPAEEQTNVDRILAQPTV